MKIRLRILGLAAALSLASLATVHASDYGTCYVYCENGQYLLTNTVDECCSAPHYCSGGAQATYVTWSPDEGWPVFCGPPDEQ